MTTLHPMIVHFHIALLLVGVASDLLYGRARFSAYPSLSTIGLWCTTLGAVMLVPAILTGLFVQSFLPVEDEGIRTVLTYHERLSYLELVLFGGLLFWRWDARGEQQVPLPVPYQLLAALGAGLILISGFLGGKMVYGFGIGILGSAPMH